MQRYPSHLGSGWSQIVRAIRQALSDGKLAVVEEGLSTLAVAVSAADSAGCFHSVAPALLGLAVIAATLESHPHLCFAALKCIEAMTAVLLQQRIGTAVRFQDLTCRAFASRWLFNTPGVEQCLMLIALQ